MTRVKRGIISVKRREKTLRYTKGFGWGRKTKERQAREALLHAWAHAYRDRRRKKREHRALWQVKINAAARTHGMTYSRFTAALKKADIALDRKILAELAEKHPDVFEKIARELKPA